MNLMELAVDCRLPLQVLPVQPLDEFMSWLLALVFGVVAVTQGELAVRRRMVADPPAAGGMAVVLLDQLIHAGGDRADDAELGQVRAKPRPEPVVGPGSLMMPVCTSNQCPDNRAWITHRTTPAAAAHTSPAVTMGRHFIITHHPEWIRVLSRSLLRFLLAGARTGWPGWAPAPPCS